MISTSSFFYFEKTPLGRFDLFYGLIRCNIRGNGMASRMCFVPAAKVTIRSIPIPNPPCGTVPHGGFGIGIERMVTFAAGTKHIREAIPFPRMLHRIKP